MKKPSVKLSLLSSVLFTFCVFANQTHASEQHIEAAIEYCENSGGDVTQNDQCCWNDSEDTGVFGEQSCETLSITKHKPDESKKSSQYVDQTGYDS